MNGPEPVEKIIERLADENGAVDVGSVLDALKASEGARKVEHVASSSSTMSLVRLIEKMHAEGLLPESELTLQAAEMATILDTARGIVVISYDALVVAVTEQLAALDRLDPDRVWGDEDNPVAAELRRIRGLLESVRDELQGPVDRLRSFVARIESQLPPDTGSGE